MLRMIWQWTKLLTGAVLVAISILGMLPNETAQRFERLEAEGRLTKGIVTGLTERRERLPTHLLGVLGPAGGFAGGAIAGHRAALDLQGREEEDPTARHYRYVEYAFQTSQGQKMRGVTEIGPVEMAAMAEGDRIDVLYHPVTPGIHRLPGLSTPYEPVPLGMKIFTALSMAAFGGYLIRHNLPLPARQENPGARALRRRRRLIEG